MAPVISFMGYDGDKSGLRTMAPIRMIFESRSALQASLAQGFDVETPDIKTRADAKYAKNGTVVAISSISLIG